MIAVNDSISQGFSQRDSTSISLPSTHRHLLIKSMSLSTKREIAAISLRMDCSTARTGPAGREIPIKDFCLLSAAHFSYFPAFPLLSSSGHPDSETEHS